MWPWPPPMCPTKGHILSAVTFLGSKELQVIKFKKAHYSKKKKFNLRLIQITKKYTSLHPRIVQNAVFNSLWKWSNHFCSITVKSATYNNKKLQHNQKTMTYTPSSVKCSLPHHTRNASIFVTLLFWNDLYLNNFKRIPLNIMVLNQKQTLDAGLSSRQRCKTDFTIWICLQQCYFAVIAIWSGGTYNLGLLLDIASMMS